MSDPGTTAAGDRTPRPRLSVVVPTLDEAERLPLLLTDLEALDAEIVVADGRSRDATPEIAREHGARVLSVPARRGRQLRAGADAARGDWLFFVHADCRLGARAVTALNAFLASADADDFAHFGFELDGDAWIHRFIELGQGLRERRLGLVYGDQGLVVSRYLHDRVGGYPDWPLMEDVEMVRRLGEHGRRITLPAPLVTSDRRYREEGGLRRWARNVALMTLHRLGASPELLSRWYRPRTVASVGRRGDGGERLDSRDGRRKVPGRARPAATSSDDRRRVVGVFAKAPRPGRVKTRLAADLGEARAVAIYRALGRATVDALRHGPYRLLVFVDPPTAEALEEVRAWLGPDGIELQTQSEGDLGARMAAALDQALGQADGAVLVGTDIPGIDRTTMEAAFAALDDHDLVLGPATDGGYYLVGLQRPRPPIFQGIPWSTDRVLSDTLDRAAREGLSVALLEEKSDVDTVADLPPRMRTGSPARA